MNPLQSLQSDFQSFLLRREEGLLSRVAGTARVDAQTRVAIYYDAYRQRLLEALDANYPVLHAWIGDDEFEQLGLAYLDAHPSQHFSIRYFGHRLPEFLGAEAHRDRPYLAEMAALEWALSEAFDAADDEIMRIEDIAGIPPDAWPGMRLRFHASVRRLNLSWNVPAIWKAINQNIEAEKNGAEATTEVPAPAAEEYPRAWLIWRQELKTYFRSLPVDEAWAIDTAVAGGSFAEICEGLTEWIDAQNVAVHAAGLLKQWITNGLIREIVIA
ncbi:MAG TPA: DNA-binding domain-containing protein [Candidatus Methylomirabilis sp.]|nr:DNA-binding domain-containing protein [Candidatus Methylomirabilis sp.]